MKITRVFTEGNRVIYRRDRNGENSVKLYAEAVDGQMTGNEWKTKSQIVSYLKKLGIIRVA